MSLTLGMTGMDHATETALTAAFTHANARLGGRWQLLPEAEAEHVLVDMDSMYGPMSWLRLHAAGKRVVGLTTAPRTQTDFHLGRPFDIESSCELLRTLAQAKGIELSAKDSPAVDPPAPAPTPATDTAPASAAPSIEAAPSAAAPIAAPIPTPILKDPAPVEEIAPQAAKPAPVSPPEPEPAAEPPPPAPPRDPVFADWLAPAALAGRVRYRRASGPTLLIDPASHTYHGPGTLKPVAAYFEGTVRREDFESVDDASWARESQAAGAAQPLSRLQWLGSLVAGNGALLPGNDPEGRYKLGKWPQTEREYPRHFRIATAMMKGPATLAEIAEASGIPREDVADFINANLATGFAEFVPEPLPEPVEPPKPTGLFGRLRGR